jgi:[ribosomal protein S5]-alanine N-acetyltransferase
MGEPVELRTKRLLLRPFILEDADDVLEYANDPDWVRYLVNIPHPFTRKDAEAFVVRFSNTAAWETLPTFAIVLDGKVIGEIYLNQPDHQNMRAELGYSLSKKHWGKGFTVEAARAVIDWAFRTYDFNRIYATCDARNVRSCWVIEKLGMKQEGLLRKHFKWNGEFRDHICFGILRSEWKG